MKSARSFLFLPITLLISICLVGVGWAAPIMVEKNLFSQDRKPVSDEEPPPQAAAGRAAQAGLPPRSVQLDGVFIQDSTKKALLRVSRQLLGEGRGRGGAREQLPYMTVTEGDSIGDFKVMKIDPRSVLLGKNKEVYTINLFMDGKVVPPATPLPAAPISPPPAAQANPAAAAAPAQVPQAAQGVLPGQAQQEVQVLPPGQAPQPGLPTGTPTLPAAPANQPAAAQTGQPLPQSPAQ